MELPCSSGSEPHRLTAQTPVWRTGAGAGPRPEEPPPPATLPQCRSAPAQLQMLAAQHSCLPWYCPRPAPRSHALGPLADRCPRGPRTRRAAPRRMPEHDALPLVAVLSVELTRP